MAAPNFDGNMRQGMPNQAPQGTVMWPGTWTDSGVISGVSTGAEPSERSVMGGQTSEFKPTYVQMDPSFGQQLAQSRDGRIREAMFGPDPTRPGGSVLSSTSVGGEPTNVQQLAPPSQQVTDSVANLITYQDDADIAQQAIPELMRLLQDSDSVVVNRSAMMVHQLSKKEASRHAIMNSHQMMGTIVQVLNKTGDNETQHFLAGTLHNVSHHKQGLTGIFQSGGIPVLVRLLRSSLESVLFFAITTLHNLLLHQDGAKKAVRDAGGIPEMVRLLSHSNVKFLAITTDCLQTLSYGNQESKQALLSNGAPRELVRIMATCTYEKLLWTTCRLLKVLSVCPLNKPVLVEFGAVQALGRHLATSPPSTHRLVLNCLWTIRNLSDAATRLEDIDQLLTLLCDMLLQNIRQLASQPGPFGTPSAPTGAQAIDHAQVVSCVCGILSNLTCNNMRNKQVLTRINGVRVLVCVLTVCMQLNTDRDDILEPAVCALRHLTAKHPDIDSAQNQVREENGIPALVHFLASPSTSSLPSAPNNIKWPVQKALASLVRNLSMSQPNSFTLRDCGAIRKLLELLSMAQQLLQNRQNAASQSAMGQAAASSTQVDGVRLEEVLEHACGALHILARDPASRAAIAAHNCVPLFVSLLYVPAESVQRAACGLLSELAADREQAMRIEQVGGDAPLTELLHSRHQVVQQLAALVLTRLSDVKPPEYQARLRMELQNSMRPRQPQVAPGPNQSQFNNYATQPGHYAQMQQGYGVPQHNHMMGVDNPMGSQVAMGQVYQSGPPPGYSTLPPNNASQFGPGPSNSMNANVNQPLMSGPLGTDNFDFSEVMQAVADDQMYYSGLDQPLAVTNVDYLTNQVGSMQPYGYGSGVRTPASGAMTPLTPPTGTLTPAEFFHSDL